MDIFSNYLTNESKSITAIEDAAILCQNLGNFMVWQIWSLSNPFELCSEHFPN